MSRPRGAKVPPELLERLPPEVRAGLPEDLEFRPDRIGFDVRREVEHLARNLSLDEAQRRLVRARLVRNNAMLRRHAAARRRHSERMRAVHRRILALNRVLERDLKGMEREEEGARRQVRRLLRPDQRKVYDMLLSERRRIERMWVEMREKQAEGGPPPTGTV